MFFNDIILLYTFGTEYLQELLDDPMVGRETLGILQPLSLGLAGAFNIYFQR